MRLISFLGTGKYGETSYALNDKQIKTRYIAFALKCLLNADEVSILATHDARKVHGESLSQLFIENGMTPPLFIEIPHGGEANELWQQFQIISDAITFDDPDTVAFDITHGFRAQPFFAAAVISHLRATENLPDNFQVYYGEYRQDQEISPVWDVSTFVSLLNWAHALNIFVKTGSAHAVATLATKKRDQVFRSGTAKPISLSPLTSALKDFSDDLSTVRCQSLITGANNRESTSKRLVDAIEKSVNDVKQFLPPLENILEQLKQQIHPVHSESLFGDEGFHAMKNLARLYLHYNRYPESLITIREGWVSLYSDNTSQDDSTLLQKEERQQAEQRFIKEEPHAKTMADFRNDVQHGGFRPKPTPAETIQTQTQKLFTLFSQATVIPAQKNDKQGHTYFISRHSGALAWAKRQGIKIDQQLTHFNPQQTQPNDVIIGTLPINLIAEVCSRGGKYFHLSLDLPPDMRGKELTAEDMTKYNARLEEYSAFAIK